jgi:hypothetical protein
MANKVIDMNERFLHYGIVPHDITGAAHVGNYFSMKNYRHAKIILFSGAWAGGSSAITINRAKSVTGTSTEVWIKWDTVYVKANNSAYNGEDTSETQLFTKTDVTSYTKAMSAANEIWVIEFDAIELDYDGGDFDCFALLSASPSSNTDILGCIVELSQPRFAGNTTSTTMPAANARAN